MVTQTPAKKPYNEAMQPLFELLEQQVLRILRRHGFYRRRAEIDGHWVHAIEGKGSGSLPTLVVVHGISANATELARMYIPLKAHFQRIIALDLPGHGWSEAPQSGMRPEPLIDLFSAAVQHFVGREPFVMFGNSLGGLAAIRYAGRHPDTVKALILSSPGGAAMSEADWSEFKQRINNHTVQSARHFLNRLYRKVPWYGPLLAPYVHHRFNTPALRSLIDQIHPQDLLRPEEVQQLAMPTLVIWGQQDQLLTDQLPFFKAYLPAHAEVDEPAHFTHCPYLEDPLELAEKVVGYTTKIIHIPKNSATVS
jgi:pimeloyl-ACP methyl ester carboxylesterase